MANAVMRTRQQPRNPIAATGHCRSMRGMQWDVALTDISENGCRVQLPHGALMNGENVKLFIAGSGPHRARVRWREGHEAGVKFEKPLTQTLIDQIRSGQVIAQTLHDSSDWSAGRTPGFGRRTAVGPVRFV